MKEFEDFKRINTCEFRNFYVPFDEYEDFKFIYGIIDKKKSSLYIDLDGIWNIKEHNSIDEFSIDEELTNTIKVPSCVQMEGYDHIQYINTRTPFPVDPPYVPKENPTYHYKKVVNINKKENKVYIMNFLGVDSCFYLYVNKKYVGFSEISHSLSEFDITEYLIDGNNTIDVVVLKWCSGSYLECQDKFRFTGIFRDVYILERPIHHITNYKISTTNNVLKVENLSNVDITFSFLNKEYKVLKNEVVKVEVDNVRYWSNKDPYLYELILKSNGEKIYEKIGFRDIKIDGRIFYLNNEKIKLKGVNRHEFSPINGATISILETYKDLMIIKDMNANAIRTSHYPDIPEFYLLTDLLGIYVVDEADLEMHEGATMYGGYEFSVWETLANNTIFSDAILDREISLIERDKNRCSVIIFSLGNEASFGDAFKKGYEYLRNNSDRPIHYEGVCNTSKEKEYRELFDVYSEMYPSIEKIKDKYLNDPLMNKPFMLCEYTHAMGNSCGDIKDYWDLINSSDQFFGAFVWEYNEHAILTKDGYKYGGDFKEVDHDFNFCVDGLVTPDRKYKSSTYEVKAIYGGNTESNTKDIEIKDYIPYSKDVKVSFNKETGLINSILVDNKEILVKEMNLNYRRYIDNDMHDMNYFNNALRLDKSKPYVYSIEEKENTIKFNCALVSDTIAPIMKYSLEYKLLTNGIDITLKYKLSEFVKNFQRVGIELEFDSKYNDFSYIGYGPYESYNDKHYASTIDLYNSNAKDNYYHYIMPQESGSHYKTKYIEIKDLLCVTGNKDFSFSYNPYNTKELIDKKHDYELKTNSNVLCLDLGMKGVGSHSCGPILDSKYDIKMEDENTFKIRF